MKKGFSALVIPLLVLLFIASTFLTFKFLKSKTQETKTIANRQTTTETNCNGLLGMRMQDVKWNVYKDTENKFSIEYPSVFTAENTGDWVSFKIERVDTSAIIWLNVKNNPKHLSITQLWAENLPNLHSGELIETDYVKTLKSAKDLLTSAQQLNVGQTHIKGYSLNIADVLERTEIYWLANSNVYNLGFSPQDKAYGCLGAKKEEIVNYMLSSFQNLP